MVKGIVILICSQSHIDLLTTWYWFAHDDIDLLWPDTDLISLNPSVFIEGLSFHFDWYWFALLDIDLQSLNPSVFIEGLSSHFVWYWFAPDDLDLLFAFVLLSFDPFVFLFLLLLMMCSPPRLLQWRCWVAHTVQQHIAVNRTDVTACKFRL